MVKTANEIYRDFEVNGVPASGSHKPIKLDIRDWGTMLENQSGMSTAATASSIKALDPTVVQSCFRSEKWREGLFVWQTGDFTAQLASDGYDAVYIKATSVPITSGCWVRIPSVDGVVEIDWFGARTAADILPLFDKAKLIAAGGTLLFGAATYVTSNTLTYEGASNKPLVITGVSEDDTIIQMQGAGFAIQYYGVTGGGNEVRGGGVFSLAIQKTGGGSCNGVDIANIYRGAVQHVNTDLCGANAIGIRVTGRGAGDTDATDGFIIEQNRCRSGLIGIQIRGDTSGSIVCTKSVIQGNNCDGNAQCGIWLAQCDNIYVADNTITACGDGHGGVNKRGDIYVENFGVHPRLLMVERNECGNGLAGATADIIIDALIGGIFRQNRHIRNAGEFGTGGIQHGLDATPSVIKNIVYQHEFFNIADAAGYTAFLAGGSGKSYAGNEIKTPIYNVYAPATRYAAASQFALIEEDGVDIKTLNGSTTFDPPSIAIGASTTTTVPVTGAGIGDFVDASFTTNLNGVVLAGYVAAVDVATVVFLNNTGTAKDLTSGTLRARIRKP